MKRYVYVYENANSDKYYGYDTYTSAPYAFVYRVTENSVSVVLMNVPAKAAVFDFLLDGRVVGTPKDHTSAYEFEVSDNAQHTFSIQPFDSNNKPVITGPYAYNFNTLMGIQMTIGAREFDYDRRIKEEQLCNVFGEIAGKKIYKEFQSHKDLDKAKVWCIWTALDGGDSELNDIMAKVKMFGYM